MNEQKYIQYDPEGNGLECDNENCDWEDKTIKWSDAHNWIDKPCPKCGENLLTQDDYDQTNLLFETIDSLNLMSKDELVTLGESLGLTKEEIEDETLQHTKVKVHNGIHIEPGDNVNP